MKIEKLEVSSRKNKFMFTLGALFTLVLVILINYFTSRANYRNTQSIDLAKGTITYKVPDLNVIAMFIDGKPTDTMPGKGYEIDQESSYCYTTDSQAHEEDITLSLNNNGNLEISNLKKGSKCYLYFVEKITAEKTLAKLEKARGSQYTIAELTAPFGKDVAASPNKLYSYPENGDITYIFRNATDNWLRFAGKTWRIIRINSDGTLRVIFQCNSNSCTTTTGSGTNALTSKSYNTSGNNTFVGYYYGETSGTYNQTHSNKTKSLIADEVTKWYNSNLSKYTNKISGSTGFCNDRRLSSGTGIEAQTTNYAPFERFYSKASVIPDLSCEKNDLYTTTDSPGNGNGVLEVPAALITADDAALAGILYIGQNLGTSVTNYLYTGQGYWTMSPGKYDNSGSSNVYVFKINNNGELSYDVTYTQLGVRPVINLKADINITGAGTTSEPFIVS